MRSIIRLGYLLLLMLLPVSAICQNTVKERKVVEIMPAQTFYLNGGARATFGGKSRVWYPIQLPPNTVEWYYSFTTQRGQDATAVINLFAQLTRIYDPTGTTAIATNALLTPTGAAACDIYLMDRPNADKFLDKVDNWSGTYSYMVSGSRLNYKNGTIQVKDIQSGTWYLGFKNPSASEGISVTFAVSAIIEETKVIEKSEEEKKAEMYAELGWKAYEKGQYDKCMELSKKALEIYPGLGWVNNNIGLVHLIQGNYTTAIDSYSCAISYFKKSANAKVWFGEAIKDLNNLIATHGNIEGAEDILELLKAEVK